MFEGKFKMTFENLKVYVKNRTDNLKVQKEMMSRGYKWSDEGFHFLDKHFLYFDDSGCMAYGNNDENFNEVDCYQKVTVEDILGTSKITIITSTKFKSGIVTK